MIEGIGLIFLGCVMLVSAPIGYYHASWKSPWHVAGWGGLSVVLGIVAVAPDLL